MLFVDLVTSEAFASLKLKNSATPNGPGSGFDTTKHDGTAASMETFSLFSMQFEADVAELTKRIWIVIWHFKGAPPKLTVHVRLDVRQYC